MPFYLRSPPKSTEEVVIHHPKPESEQAKSKSKDTTSELKPTDQQQNKSQAQDTMAPKQYYESSGSSNSEGERIHHNSRRAERSANRPRQAARPVEIHNHKKASENEPKRPANIDGKRWQ